MDVVVNRSLVARLRNYVRRIPFMWSMYWVYWKIRTWMENQKNYESNVKLINLGNQPEPDLEKPTSQLCTASQFYCKQYKYWCKEMDSPPRFSRKQWEFVYIMEVLRNKGMLFEGSKGLGFGCGSEPLPGIFAKRGCEILATDLEKDAAKERGWVDTMQHSNNLEDMFKACNKIIDKELFYNKVTFQNVNMNHVPVDLCGFDFVWSACALEHLGSLRHGLEFIQNSVLCLKPGGIAVHTTEFNLTSDDDTFETDGCSVYRKKDLCLLIDKLEKSGHKVEPLNLNSGNMKVDNYVDAPPYRFSPHLKLFLDGYVVTSVGLVIERKAN